MGIDLTPGGELDVLELHVWPYPIGAIENKQLRPERATIPRRAFGTFSDRLESTDETLSRVGAYLRGVLLKSFINEDLQQFITFEQFKELQNAKNEQMMQMLEKRGFLRRA